MRSIWRLSWYALTLNRTKLIEICCQTGSKLFTFFECDRWNLVWHTTFQWLVCYTEKQRISPWITMIITEIQYFSSKIIRFQAIFKDTVEFTCALEFKISSQLKIVYIFAPIRLSSIHTSSSSRQCDNTSRFSMFISRWTTVFVFSGISWASIQITPIATIKK